VNIAVDVDIDNATLLAPARAAFLPAPRACTRVADICQLEAPPLRQFTKTLAAELPGESGFLAILAGADDMWTDLPMMTAVGADQLLLGEDGIAEQGVDGGGLFIAANR
jgi:hypothetical protein